MPVPTDHNVLHKMPWIELDTSYKRQAAILLGFHCSIINGGGFNGYGNKQEKWPA